MRRFTRTLFVVLTLAAPLALATPAAAQQGPGQGGPLQGPDASREGLDRAAARHGFADWAAPSAHRAGIDPTSIEVPGFVRAGLQVDPRRGRATVLYRGASPLAQGGDEPAGVIDVTLFETAKDARQSLLQRITTVTGALAAEPNLGDVAFAARDGLRATWVAFVRGNVTAVARVPGAKLDALAFAQAADAAVLAAATLTPGQPLPRPVIGGAWAEDLRAGHPGTLHFERDPASPAPAWLAAESADGNAGVLQTETGWQVYAARPSRITLTLHVCSAELQTATVEVELTVGK